jgi:hypothetical protein
VVDGAGEGSMKRAIPTAHQLYFPRKPHAPADLSRLERDFFGTIRQRNGTYKYTYENRLDDLNEAVGRWLPVARPLGVMDVAVSSGVSTIEWCRDLERRGVEHSMTAGDIHLMARLVSLPGGFRVLIDRKGHPLQYDLRGKAVPNPPAKKTLPLVLPGILLCRLGVLLRRRGLEAMNCEGAVPLVSPRLLAETRIDLVEDDILTNQSLSRRFHVVRAANILNRDYFRAEILAQMAANLIERLVDGGLLALCSTTDDSYNDTSKPRSNDGTIFIVRGPGRVVEVVERIGAGSEVEELVLGLGREKGQV